MVNLLSVHNISVSKILVSICVQSLQLFQNCFEGQKLLIQNVIPSQSTDKFNRILKSWYL